MAFKNLARYKKRTMITAGAIAYGLMMFIVMQSLLTGINRESETNLRLYETASGRIMVPGYWDERESFPLKKSFDPEILSPVLEKSGAAYSPRISFGGDLIFYKDPFPVDGSIGGRFTAIDPEKDSEGLRLKDSLSEGEWLKDGEPGLLLGYWLAEDIGAEIGSTVLVETQTRDGYAQVFDLEVLGFLNCPNPEITRSGMFLPLSTANEYLEMNGDVTEMNVNFGGRSAESDFAALAGEVEKTGLQAVDWRVLGADFFAISRAKAAGTGTIVFLILIIAAVGISNTMLMAVFERVRELGMMQALGMRRRQIRALFLWESAGIGILGGIYGVGLGALVSWPLAKWGIDYSFLLRESSFGYRIQGHMYGVWDIKSMIAAFAMAVGMAVLVAAFSTHRILKLDIPSSLRFE
jgi:ABC-type lipoprotein release transport system permease subunit